MAKLTIKSEFNTFTIQHRAVCKSSRNHWKGDWYDSPSLAEDEADVHIDDNPSHIVYIETKQTSSMRSLYTRASD